MVVLTKPGMANYEWHSFEKYDKSSKADKEIIAGMLRRFMEKDYAQNAQVIQFYDNRQNLLIDQYSAT